MRLILLKGQKIATYPFYSLIKVHQSGHGKLGEKRVKAKEREVSQFIEKNDEFSSCGLLTASTSWFHPAFT